MIAARRITGRHVLWGMIGFFGVIFAVNGTFLYVALMTWTGADVDNAYVRGIAYNRVLEAAEAQRALGWTVVVDSLTADAGTADLTLSYKDAEGAPMSGLSVDARFRHPVQRAYDRTVTLSDRGSGLYGAVLALPSAGLWDVHAVALGDDDTRHVLEFRTSIE